MTSPGMPPESGTRDKPRILVVDDEPDTLGLLQLTLQTAGFEVDTAANGTQAIDRATQDHYDLIVLDVMMPDLSGFEVLRRLQAGSSGLPPVVFLTAKARPEDRQAGESLGATAYLIKPTTRGQLLDIVREALAKPAGKDAPG
ncbi:MAG: response regulator transcription factor [Anaerolineales bacterium]